MATKMLGQRVNTSRLSQTCHPHSVLVKHQARHTPARSRRNLQVHNAAMVKDAAIESFKVLEYEEDRNGLQRMKYEREGWNFWQWRGHKVHWLAAGPEDAPPVILVHGYGASAYHWRYNIPALAKNYRVYALCLLGFGWSEKALVDYSNGNQWIAQISEFVEQVVGGEPVILAGNSLGGYASLATAAYRPDLVRGVALLNGAGPFADADKPPVDPDAPLATGEKIKLALSGLVKRVVLFFAFNRAKQPERIKEVLGFVYMDKAQIDDVRDGSTEYVFQRVLHNGKYGTRAVSLCYATASTRRAVPITELVDSIVTPATDPLACEVFFRLNHGQRPPLTVNYLLNKLQSPLLLLWGMKDPWITPARAEAVRALYPAAQFVPLNDAGHCPHDDTPQPANEALLKWMEGLPARVVDTSLAAQAARLRL